MASNMDIVSNIVHCADKNEWLHKRIITSTNCLKYANYLAEFGEVGFYEYLKSTVREGLVRKEISTTLMKLGHLGQAVIIDNLKQNYRKYPAFNDFQNEMANIESNEFLVTCLTDKVPPVYLSGTPDVICGGKFVIEIKSCIKNFDRVLNEPAEKDLAQTLWHMLMTRVVKGFLISAVITPDELDAPTLIGDLSIVEVSYKTNTELTNKLINLINIIMKNFYPNETLYKSVSKPTPPVVVSEVAGLVQYADKQLLDLKGIKDKIDFTSIPTFTYVKSINKDLFLTSDFQKTDLYKKAVSDVANIVKFMKVEAEQYDKIIFEVKAKQKEIDNLLGPIIAKVKDEKEKVFADALQAGTILKNYILQTDVLIIEDTNRKKREYAELVAKQTAKLEADKKALEDRKAEAEADRVKALNEHKKNVEFNAKILEGGGTPEGNAPEWVQDMNTDVKQIEADTHIINSKLHALEATSTSLDKATVSTIERTAGYTVSTKETWGYDIVDKLEVVKGVQNCYELNTAVINRYVSALWKENPEQFKNNATVSGLKLKVAYKQNERSR